MLSTMIICKNEATRIEGCIKSVYDASDEIIVVDTGSTDKTNTILDNIGEAIERSNGIPYSWLASDRPRQRLVHKQFSPKEFISPRTGMFSFSMAKNKALSFCTGDMILNIDADERLVLRGRRRFDTSANALLVNIVNPVTRIIGRLRTAVYFSVMARIFPNVDGLYFERDIHESISLSLLGKNISAVHEPWDMSYIAHIGYDIPDIRMLQKIERNLSMLIKSRDADPGDPWNYHYLGKTYGLIGDRVEALRNYLRALELKGRGLSVEAIKATEETVTRLKRYIKYEAKK